MLRFLSSQSVSVHLRILRLCGFYRQRNAHNKEFTIFHATYRSLMLALTLLYLLQECIYAYQVCGYIDNSDIAYDYML